MAGVHIIDYFGRSTGSTAIALHLKLNTVLRIWNAMCVCVWTVQQYRQHWGNTVKSNAFIAQMSFYLACILNRPIFFCLFVVVDGVGVVRSFMLTSCVVCRMCVLVCL